MIGKTMRLIDADALISELLRGINADTDRSVQTEFTKSLCMILCKAIEKRPTIDAVPVRHGSWQKVGYIDSTWLVYKCSVCNGQTIDGGNYCPNCGAKMEVEHERSD